MTQAGCSWVPPLCQWAISWLDHKFWVHNPAIPATPIQLLATNLTSDLCAATALVIEWFSGGISMNFEWFTMSNSLSRWGIHNFRDSWPLWKVAFGAVSRRVAFALALAQASRHFCRAETWPCWASHVASEISMNFLESEGWVLFIIIVFTPLATCHRNCQKLFNGNPNPTNSCTT